MFGYWRQVGVTLVLEAELITITDSLHLIWEKGIRQLIVESGNKMAVDLILQNERGGHEMNLEIGTWTGKIDGLHYDLFHEQQTRLLMLLLKRPEDTR